MIGLYDTIVTVTCSPMDVIVMAELLSFSSY